MLLLVLAEVVAPSAIPTSCSTSAVDASTSMQRRTTLSMLSPRAPTGILSTRGSAIVRWHRQSTLLPLLMALLCVA